MPKRERVQKQHQEHTHEDVLPTEETQANTESSKNLKDDLDGILDEIDEVLEENAQQFVESFVQRGGQ